MGEGTKGLWLFSRKGRGNYVKGDAERFLTFSASVIEGLSLHVRRQGDAG
jgi:hypothetical protein